MDYSFLGQDATVVVGPQSSGFGRFFRPITRFFPNFFPVQPRLYPVAPACIPVPVPAGTLGRDANGNLTVNGQTHCYSPPSSMIPTQPYGRPVPYGPIYL